MTARRIHIHAGLPKTGTTFLQTVMWSNRDALRQQGFLYPGRQRMDHYRASQEIRGVSPRRMGRHAGTWQRLVDELSAWPGDGLVSHEFLSMATAEQARSAVAALAPAEVHVVVTVRAYSLQFPAVWQEALKMNSTLSFTEFMDTLLHGNSLKGAWSWDSQDIPTVLRRWSSVIPPDRLTVVTVPPPGAPRDLLWKRWCEAVGIDDADLDLDVSYANESIGAAQAALLHRVKPHLSGPLTQGNVRHRWVRQYFGHEVLVPQRGERFSPRRAEVAELQERAAAAADFIRASGHPVIGDLADLTPPIPESEAAHPDDVPGEEIVTAASRAIEQMIRDVKGLTAERDRWRRRALAAENRSVKGQTRRIARRAREAFRRR